jgi:hypothetical protein
MRAMRAAADGVADRGDAVPAVHQMRLHREDQRRR